MICTSRSTEVAVWWMRLGSPSAAAVKQWRACLDPSEQAQADKFYVQADRSTYVAAHWLVRSALASVGNLPPANWRFIVEEHGKPKIDRALGRSELRFNLSHTRGFVACAVSVGVDVGIDVETLTPSRASLDIAERYFSPSEVAILRGAPPDEQAECFFRLWTLKEAFIKATGEGLSRPLDSFSFSLNPASISFSQGEADDAPQWQFIEQRPSPQHVLALAVRKPASCPLTLSVCQVRSPE
ncbi:MULTISPECIES: 4'-phosphopantetheinyl transferase family protein [Bradyrhizobium]|uniref:4'-phosphopantetheinyl transferase superfamily protein n=3 Tax=Bradyrhizobium TaxID=374 RepID=A0ABS3MVQ0_9BRAD|nr:MULTISPECIES: 4'-phosphopantetheinyl transferase superfamily protein [Bradyrhizobium]UFX49368.1 4'-phosphopantetheinyl transferase superfamily protein [Bradyrhizobium sp. 41S5]UGA49093.1 4'-phosphopantetheinyl transferase superfamily protein [Bradyrhizobium quebecense]UGY07494.1 4'-phosphopantetheinyl transferase superfamily protein [Bradyrhizobium quebecense]